MPGFFSRLLRKSPPSGGRDLVRYEEEKTAANDSDVKKRLKLAGNPKTHQEILYYLATHDKDPGVRLAVVRNPSTPVHVSSTLAIDPDLDVRMALAERLLLLLPNIDQGRQAQLYGFAVQALGTLALDQVLHVRRALSSALKDAAYAPPKVVAQLARDIEREVAEPILRFCAALPDEDLIDILKNHKESWAIQAIAGRPKLSETLSQAVFARDDREAGTILLGNTGALITMELMESIIDKSKTYTEWQNPLAVHAKLSGPLARRLAAFADATVRDALAKRTNFDPKEQEEILALFHQRMEYAEEADQAAGIESPRARAARLNREGKLDETAVLDAAAMRDRPFVVAALAELGRADPALVEKIFDLKAPKPIVALCRRSGLSMRAALQLQKETGQVAPPELIYPRGGTDYPLSDEEMQEQLKFLGG